MTWHRMKGERTVIRLRLFFLVACGFTAGLLPGFLQAGDQPPRLEIAEMPAAAVSRICRWSPG